MKLTELVSSVQSHLEDHLPVEVKVKEGNNLPAPAVLIESWEVDNIIDENMRYKSSRYDSDGTEVKRIYTLPYDASLSFLVRHESSTEASELFDSLRQELLKLEVSPTKISDEISRVDVGGGGGISYQFASPKEAEMTQSATFTTRQVYVRDDFETFEDISIDVEAIE